MTKVRFIAKTITKKGTFHKGDEVEFSAEEAKDLRRLNSVESPTPSVKKKAPKKVKNDEPKTDS